MKLIKRIRKGFTLVELVVVIAIIAILSGVSVAVYVGITNNAKESACKQEATSVATVLRAMALSDANGYEVVADDKDTAVNEQVLVVWDSDKGLHFIDSTGHEVTSGDDKLMEKIYKKSEAIGDTTELTFELKDNDTNNEDGFVKSFTYKANASEYKATYNLVDNTIKVSK